MEIKGVTDKIILRIIKDSMTKGGIHIPDAVKLNPQTTGKVMSKGCETGDEIKVGDIVICHNHAGMDIVIDGEIMKVVIESEVYAILTEYDLKKEE